MSDHAASAPDPTIADPNVSDSHGGASAEDLAQWYSDAVTEIAAHCHELNLRPSSIDTASWLFGIRAVIVGFPDCDKNAVDALAAVWNLPVDDAPPTGLYQRRAIAIALGGYTPTGLTVFCTDPGTQALADAAVVVATADAAVEADASPPATAADLTVAPPPPAASVPQA